MRRWLIAAIGIFVVFLWSCAEQADFTETTPTLVQPVEEEQRADTATAQNKGTIEPPPANEHEIAIQTREITEDSVPVELLFILDNSQSMAENIRDLKVKVPELFASLKENGVPYNARILTLDRFLDQLEVDESRSFMSPRGVFRDGPPDYTRGLGFDSKYLEVIPFSQDFGVDEIAAAIEGAILDNRAIHNEPGICAAMDYINWVSYTEAITDRRLKFSDEQNLHVILLSDEDNARVFDDIDIIDNRVRESLDLFCYQTRNDISECRRYNVQLDWQGYGYKWQEKAATSYSYVVDYYEPSVCQNRGVAFPNGVDEFANITVNQRCQRSLSQVTCQDTNQPSYRYECSTPSETFPELFSVNKEALGTQRCDAIQQFECEQWNTSNGTVAYVPKNRSDAFDIMAKSDRYHRCEAGSHIEVLKNATKNGKQRCSRPQKFPCTVYNESGVPTATELDYSQVIGVDLGAESYVCSAPGFQKRYQNNAIASSHQVCEVHNQFECQMWDGNEKVYANADRATAIGIINDPSPETRYQCSAMDVQGLVGLEDIGLTKGRCSVPTQLECETFPDGQLFWASFSWSQARQLLDDYPERNCRLKQGAVSYQSIDVDLTGSIYQSQDRYLTESCAAYSCEDVSELSCRLKSGAVTAPTLVSNNDPGLLDKPKYYIETCSAISCDPVQNITCDLDGGIGTVWEDLLVSDPRPDNAMYQYDSCSDYSCVDQGELECRVPDGVVAVPTDFAANNPQLSDKPANFIDSCESYTCSQQVSGYQTVTITPQQQAADPDRYQSCGAPVNEVTTRPKFVLNADAAGAFVSLTKKECSSYGSGFTTVATSATLDPQNLCKSLVLEKLAAQGYDLAQTPSVNGFEVQGTGVINQQTEQSATTAYAVGSKTKEQLAAELGILPAAIFDYGGSQKTVQGKQVEQYFVYEKYPAGSNDRSVIEEQTINFEEITESAYVGPQSVLLQAGDYARKYPRNGNLNDRLGRDDPIWTKHVTETEVNDPDGVFEMGCDETKVETVNIRPTAENFVELMTELYPKRSFTWHSIVNLDGEKCSPEDTANTAKGSEYLELTELTKGVSASICETNSGGLVTFLGQLARNVINELDLVYELPDGVSAESVAAVVNATSGKTLVQGTDYKFDSSEQGGVTIISIIFTKGAVAESDVVDIQYR